MRGAVKREFLADGELQMRGARNYEGFLDGRGFSFGEIRRRGGSQGEGCWVKSPQLYMAGSALSCETSDTQKKRGRKRDVKKRINQESDKNPESMSVPYVVFFFGF